ncbi:MAG TPA: dipeptidase, partial [Candidatus Alistipes excrementipullorum]|nr:dipeptidase [Candidatus Alistipes excrementipullorum]
LNYDRVAPAIRKVVDEWENGKLEEVKQIDAVYASSPKKRMKKLTEYSVNTAQSLFDKWVELDRYLLVKFMDGNIKSEDENGFIDNGNGRDIPDKIEQPGYSEKWKRAVAADNGKVLRVVK